MDYTYGLNVREWADVRDRYIATNTITPDDLERMNRDQRLVINEIKKSFKSVRNKIYEIDEGTDNYIDEEDTILGNQDPPY